MNTKTCRSASLALSILVLTQAGCARSKPARYYMLTARTVSSGSTAQSTGGRQLAVGVGPIEFPDYLKRPQIVTRTGPHGVKLAEFDRWAEPLKQTFSRVLAENLSLLLVTDNVTLYPHDRTVPTDYQVRVAVLRFDATETGEVSLVARWTVINPKSEAPSPHVSRIKEQASANGYPAMADALSRSLERLSNEIAAQVMSYGAKKE